MSYDADGRVQTATTGDGYTVRSVYDFRGERVARIVNPGAGSQVTTFNYGRWFEVTGGTLTRHMYLGDRLIADSPVAAPSGLTLASISPEERSILLARAMRDTLRWSPQLYPGYVLTAEEAAKLGALLAFILVVLGATPGRVRVGLAVQRRSPFRRLRRGHVILVIMVFGMTLTPLTCVRRANAGGSGGPPPAGTVFPVYFIHTDHLGSTVMLTCYKQGGCADRAVIRYLRYDAYGQMKAYDAAVDTDVTIQPGYQDASVSPAVPGIPFGSTFGVQETANGVALEYAGVFVGTPGGNVMISSAAAAPGPAFTVTVTGSNGVSVQVGVSLIGGFFSEVGFGVPGISISVINVRVLR